MKRAAWILLPLLAAGGVWLAGRAPTQRGLTLACKRYQEERRETAVRLTLEEARNPAAAKELENYLRGHKRLTIRGWDVLLIPAGADRPQPRDYFVLRPIDVGGGAELSFLRGSIEIWAAPRGALARFVSWLGLSP